MKLDLDQIRDLLAVVGETDITELTIESGEEKITVKKAPPTLAVSSIEVAAPPARREPAAAVAAATADAHGQAPEPAAAAPEPESRNGLVPITSPMVGTFYRSPSPSAPPFVDVGDHVTIGQTVCIIEAMKLMNDLPAEVAGRIVKVCVDSGTTVEYGQPLFMIDPKG